MLLLLLKMDCFFITIDNDINLNKKCLSDLFNIINHEKDERINSDFELSFFYKSKDDIKFIFEEYREGLKFELINFNKLENTDVKDRNIVSNENVSMYCKFLKDELKLNIELLNLNIDKNNSIKALLYELRNQAKLNVNKKKIVIINSIEMDQIVSELTNFETNFLNSNYVFKNGGISYIQIDCNKQTIINFLNI